MLFSLVIRNRLVNNGGFFVIAWACHYFPFFLMNRQLFLHHYLPAHLASALVAGAVLNFIVTESIEFPISYASVTAPQRRHPRAHTDIGSKAVTVMGVYVAFLFGVFLYIAPLTYGTPRCVDVATLRVGDADTSPIAWTGMPSTGDGYSRAGRYTSRRRNMTRLLRMRRVAP